MLARLVEGSIRDGLALLEEITAEGKDDLDRARLVRQLRGLMRDTALVELRLQKLLLDQRYQAVAKARKMTNAEVIDYIVGKYAELSSAERTQVQARLAGEDEK